MKLIDAYILARTKRKTRRIRMALVVIVSSLLFAILFFGALVAAGFKNAVEQVKDVGFNGRNITSVVLQQQMTDTGQDDQKNITNEMDNELRARRIKVPAEADRDQSYTAELFRRMNILQVKRDNERYAAAEKQIQELGNPARIYHFTSLTFMTTNLVYQPDPAKDTYVEELTKQAETGSRSTSGSVQDKLEFFTVEQDMLRTQLQPGQDFAWQPGQPYPLFVSYAYLEKLSGTSFARVSTQAKNEGYRKLMAAYSGKEITYCYRNAAAQEQLQLVVKYNKAASIDKRNDTNPISIPVCGGFNQALLKKLEIITDLKEPDVKPLFPAQPLPVPETTPMHFKIIGYVPSNAPYGTSDTITQVLSGIGSLPTGPYPGIVPREVTQQDARFALASDELPAGMPPLLYADFNTRAEQLAFLDKTCQGDECIRGTRPSIAPFGSIYLSFAGIVKGALKAIWIATGVVMGVAGLMIMFTISKVIADSTKEIAVFRALGARRRDIAQIYFTYGYMLAASAALAALLLASILSVSLSHAYADKVAAGLIAGSGAYNQPVAVSLWGVQPLWLLAIICALLLATTIGIAIPVLANLRRTLVSAMREE